jgi:hypothetical protein
VNYLSHFVFNHRVCGLEPEPYFAMGVVLPDLWVRFSRRRRIRWQAVRAAEPEDAPGAALRAGLLNHVDVDRRFHTLPVFLRWQEELKAAIDADGVHPFLVDFLAHASVELALDRALLLADERLVDEFYDLVSGCDARLVARLAGEIGDVDADGLENVVAGFFGRRFLRRYRTPAGLAEVIRIVLSLVKIDAPPARVMLDFLEGAGRIADPERVWAALTEGRRTPAVAGVRRA